MVTVIRRSTTGSVVLNYTSEGPANSAFAALNSDDLAAKKKIFTDDFGCKVVFQPEDIGTVVFMDYVKTLEINGVQALHQQRGQKKLEEAARNDPELSRAGKIVSATAGSLDLRRQ
jgi:hypothetical protein